MIRLWTKTSLVLGIAFQIFLVACTAAQPLSENPVLTSAPYPDEVVAHGTGNAASNNGVAITIQSLQWYEDTSDVYRKFLFHKGYYFVVLDVSIVNHSSLYMSPNDMILVDDAANYYRQDPAKFWGFTELPIGIEPGVSARGNMAFEIPPTALLYGNLHLTWESVPHNAISVIYLDLIAE